MYLSRIELNPRKPGALSVQRLHGAIESGVDGERQRKLWRIDTLRNKHYLLLLSIEKPELQSIAEQFGFSGSEGESKDYNTFLSRLENGQQWRFRLTANPVRCVQGKLYAHVTVIQQKQWLLDRATDKGFRLVADDFELVGREWIKFNKGAKPKEGRQVTISTASFEGLLTVSDVELLRSALVQGVGRAKAYGCGLLTLVRPTL